MDVNFELYNIFYYVCEFKSITKAANYLYVTQPAITKQIKNLESILEKKLIIKVPKGIELTDDGMMLYNDIKEPIERLQEVSSIFNARTGKYDTTFRIIAGYNTIKKLLLKEIVKFNIKYPKIKFELNSYPFVEAMQKLKEGKADLIFLGLQETIENHNNIIVEKFSSFQDILVVKGNLKNEYPERICIKEINNYPLVCKTSNSIFRSNIEKILMKDGIKFTPTYQVSNNWLVEEYVKLGLGIGFVTKELVHEELKNGELVEIATDVKMPIKEIGYAYRKNSNSVEILKKFINELSENVGK